MKRVVVDTSVVISGLLFGGAPGDIISMWKEKRLIPLGSKPIVDEYVKVLAYPKFQLTKQEIHALLLQEVLPFLEVVSVTPGKSYMAEDPADDKFIWCAVSGRAEAIISGDKHLLSLNNPPVPVQSVHHFLKQFSK